jgi:hypothetical protein
MRTGLAGLLMMLTALGAPSARAEPAEEVRALYTRFAEAQNARDLAQVRTMLVNSPQFLWVSDGMSFWGPGAVLERMGHFQKAEVWRVEPNLGEGVAVELYDTTAYLHLPLVLTIGASAKPDRLRFLVSMLGVETPGGWRIAALFTTSDKAG